MKKPGQARARLASSGVIARIEVGSNVIALQFPTQQRQRSLERDHPLRGDPPTEDPHRNLRLPHRLPCELGELRRHDELPSDLINRLLDPLNAHMEPIYNTGGVIAVNTRSAKAFAQTREMARTGEISDFWLRLTKARSIQKSPLGMRQEDIAAEWKVRQSAVTKWKTGKSVPQPELVREMALRYDVMFDWLYTGRGDMRPPRTTDPITLQVIEAMEVLRPDGRVEVLKAALTQQTMQIPAVAAQVAKARETAEQMAKPPPLKRPHRAG